MLDNPDNNEGRASAVTSRRGFLKVAAMAGAAVSFGTGLARANGEIGFWAKDLSDQQLVDMFTTILRIRWHERTMADKMLSDPNYRGYEQAWLDFQFIGVNKGGGTVDRTQKIERLVTYYKECP